MKIFYVLSSTIVLLILLPLQALAANPGPPGAHLNVTQVLVDDPNNPTSIMIIGKDLDFGSGPLSVTLGEFGALNITGTPTDGMIEADLPGLIADGDYLLTVSNGNGQSQNDEYDLTIGAVGPAGADGAQGPAGADGAQGERGLIGVTGATGGTGSTGATGMTGMAGAQGPQGDPGADGNDGATGAQGELGPPGPQGPSGSAGLSTASEFTNCEIGINFCEASAPCPDGTVVFQCDGRCSQSGLVANFGGIVSENIVVVRNACKYSCITLPLSTSRLQARSEALCIAQ